MLVYNYDMVTSEYTGTSEAIKNPLAPDEYILPSYATFAEPMDLPENEVAIFSRIDNTWEIMEDFRGKTVYSTLTKSEKVVDYIGSIEDNYTLLKPIEPTNDYFTVSWDGIKWIETFDKDKCIEALYEFYIGFQKDQIDENMNNEMLLSRGLFESNPAVTEAQLPKAKRAFDWVQELWVEYYKVKAQIANDIITEIPPIIVDELTLTFFDIKNERDEVLAAIGG